MRILHILYQSLPNQNGTSIRSRDIVSSQKQIGLDPVVITSPFQQPYVAGKAIEYIYDVKYYRTYSGSRAEEVSEAKKSLLVQLKKFIRIFEYHPGDTKPIQSNERP